MLPKEEYFIHFVTMVMQTVHRVEVMGEVQNAFKIVSVFYEWSLLEIDDPNEINIKKIKLSGS